MRTRSADLINMATPINSPKTTSEQMILSGDLIGRLHFELSSEPVFLVAKGGAIVDCNRSMERLIGFSREEICNSPLIRFLPHYSLPEWLQRLEAIPLDGTLELETEVQKFDRSHLQLLARWSEYFVCGATHWLCVLPQSSERSRFAIRQSEQETLLFEAIQIAKLGYWNWNLKRNEIYVSPELLGHLGLPPHSPWTERDFEGRLHPDDLAPTQHAIRKALRGGDIYIANFRLRHENGSYRHIESRGKVVRDLEGQLERFAGVHIDATDRQQIEKKFESVFHSAFQSIGILSKEGVLLKDNRRKSKQDEHPIFGATGHPMSSARCWRQSDSNRSRLEKATREALAGKVDRFVVCWSNEGGQRLHTDFSIKPAVASDGEVMFLIAEARDISELVEAQQRELETERRFTQAMNAAGIGMWELDLISNEYKASSRFRELIGIDTATESSAIPQATITQSVHPDDLPHVRNAFMKAKSEDIPIDVECRIRHVSGRWVWLRTQGKCICDEVGTPVRITGSHQDITERKEAEEAILRSNQDLENFAYAASHDLQEPLRAVTGYCEILENDYGHFLPEEARPFIRSARQNALRMQQLVRNLIEYARVNQKSPSHHPCELSLIVNRAMEALRLSIEQSNAEISIERLPIVRGDFGLLTILVQNLLSNAIKFTKENAPPRILISAQTANGAVHFSIRDHGIGIEAKYLQSIFDIFVRLHTQEEYQGTGIGLAICKRIAELHQSRISVSSTPTVGTEFTITFPSTKKGDA